MGETHAILVKLPIDLHSRAVKMSKKTGMTIAQLVREALDAKVLAYEERLYLEKERARRDREETRSTRQFRQIGESPLAPSLPVHAPAEAKSPDNEDETTLPVREDDDPYVTYAKYILQAEDQPSEKRLRLAEAVASIRRQSPLTCPPEHEILANLERAVDLLRQKNPSTRAPQPVTSVNPAVEVGDLIRSLFNKR